jgi:polysaccharide transporter, PST family
VQTPIASSKSTGRLIQNIFALYGIHFANILLPLLTIPHLTHVLEPKGWGLLAISQAIATYVALIVEYGFMYSASRDISVHRHNLLELRKISSGVIGSRVILSVIAFVITVVLSQLLPVAQSSSVFIWYGYVWGVLQGFTFSWFFQGLEQLKTIATIDVGIRLISTILLFTLIKHNNQLLLTIQIQLVAALLSLVIGAILFSFISSFSIPSKNTVMEALKSGGSMFIFRGATSFYTVANTLILSLFFAPEIVGYFAGAERIARAVSSLINPITQAVYPRISFEVVKSIRDAQTIIQRSAVIVIGVGTVLSVLVYLTSPLLTRIVLGQGYTESTAVLSVLSPLPFLISIASVLGVQWMLPLGYDKEFTLFILLAGLVNLVFGFLLIHYLGPIGMAWSVSIAELTVASCVILFLFRIGKIPISISRRFP